MRGLAVAVIVGVIFVAISTTTIYAQQNYDIPSWFKGVAGFWAEDKISDQEFGEGVSFLINEGLIKIPELERLKQESSSQDVDILRGMVYTLSEENQQLKAEIKALTGNTKITESDDARLASINASYATRAATREAR